jgi:hypothetical protein
LKVVINILEEHAASIFKVEVSWEGMWNSYIGNVEGSGQGEQKDWPVRARMKDRRQGPVGPMARRPHSKLSLL